MPLDAALLELKDRLKRLAAALVVVRKRLADGCPDESHYLVGRMHDAVPAAEGWLRKARRAVRAAKADARSALTKFDHTFAKLRHELRRELTGRQRLTDLTDLGRRKEKWTAWADEVRAAAADARRAAVAATRAAHDCWRKLAAQPTAVGVTISNTNVVVAGKNNRRKSVRHQGA